MVEQARRKRTRVESAAATARIHRRRPLRLQSRPQESARQGRHHAPAARPTRRRHPEERTAHRGNHGQHPEVVGEEMSKAWPKVKLGDMLRRSEETIELQPDTEYRQITVKLWGKGVVLRGILTGAEIASSRQLVARRGQFILSRIDARNGALGIVPPELDEAIVTNDFPVFDVVENRLLPKYLGWMCRTASFVEECKRASEGTTNRVRLQEDKFLEREIPLPPLAEQRRVVARIEELAAQIHEARTLRYQAAEEAEALRVSALARSLSSGDGKHSVTLPNANQKVRRGVERPKTRNEAAESWQVPVGWRLISVAELLLCGALLDVKDGNHGSNHPRSSEFVEQGTPFLMASDLGDGAVHWEEASRLGPETMSRLRVGFSRPNDVLFTHKASIGKTAMADRDCVLSPQVTYFRCNPKFIEPRWLQSFLSSSLFLSQLADIQAQSTRDFVSISKQYQQFVLLPPVPDQRRIVAELGALHAQVDALKSMQAETAAELDALLPSVLDKAFKGEL